MAFSTTWLPAVRRFAAGIDVGPSAVRLVIVSQRLRSRAPVRIESIVEMSLPPGAMAGVEIVNRPVVARTLRDVFAQLSGDVLARVMRCAMAMPGSVTLTSTLPLSQLSERMQSVYGFDGNAALAEAPLDPALDPSLNALEPAVMQEAERIAGIERHALAVDWYLDELPQRAGCITIAATGREHLEARMECAATAGITLTAVDGEPQAGLRALRYAASLELETHDPYAALWIGNDGIYGWRIVHDLVTAEIRYPAPEHADFADALRDLAGVGPLDCAMIGGETGLLDGVGMDLADIGDVLGCAALPFECASSADTVSWTKQVVADHELHNPAFAVAFGLALRGVME